VIETQDTVSRWADETFGSGGSNASVAARANIEMAELLMALTNDDNDPKAIEEVADIVIVLYRLVARANTDLAMEIDKKMAVNKARTWRLDGYGHGYHVKAIEQGIAAADAGLTEDAEEMFDTILNSNATDDKRNLAEQSFDARATEFAAELEKSP